MSNNSLIVLSSANFSIQQAKKGNVLCCNLPDISLVLFFSQKCAYCGDAIEVFKTLPTYFPKCNFGVLNISTYLDVAAMSERTIAPITYVPFIILYINGRPFMKYNGKRTTKDIIQFLQDILDRINSKKFSPNQVNQVQVEKIPEYTMGIPFNLVCEGEQCYLKYEEAYKNVSRK